MYGWKLFCVSFDKVDGIIIEIYNGTIYLELFGQRIYKAIYDRINYLMSEKKVMLNILLITTLQESELIHIILYLLKKH